MKIKISKKVFTLSIIMVLAVVGYFIGDRVWAVGVTDSDDVLVTLTVDEGISISVGNDVIMDPLSVSLLTSIGSSSWTVTTNSHAGYELAVKANADPALVNADGDFFTDYTETVADTPELWSVADGDYEFGYSVYGPDSLDATWGALDTCGTATVPGGNKYIGTEIVDKVIATKADPTNPDGVTTTICFAAEQNGIFAPSGTYTTTITATATTL